VVEIARALAIGCRVLVLDEPTSSLSLADIERLFQVIRRLKEQGSAVVYISHFLEEVKRVSDTFTVLRDGRTVGGGGTAETGIDDIVRMMIGRQVSHLYPRGRREPGEALLELHDVAGSPKPLSASFTVRRGEILGIAGLVGAGRTELVRTIFGLAPVRAGTIRVGAYHGPASPAQRWQQGAGLLSEDRGNEGLALSLTLTDNVTMGLRKGIGRFGLIRPPDLRAATRLWIERLGIRTTGPSQRTGALSGGNQQKIAIARLLYEDVDILLLDEPTRGIDVASKVQIYQLMDHLVSGDPTTHRPPRAVVVVSSYLPELLGVCDRIAVMHRGRLGEARPTSAWTEHGLMLEATGQGTTA
jgi:ribose transport system ATP-binding protein